MRDVLVCRPIIRLHRSTMYLDVVTDWVAWSVGLSVCDSSEPCKNGWTDRDAVWVENLLGPKKPCIRWGPDPPQEGAILRGRDKYRVGTLCSELCKKRLNQSRFLGPIRAHNPNGISVGSADRPRRYLVGNSRGCIYVHGTAMWPNSYNYGKLCMRTHEDWLQSPKPCFTNKW